MADSEQRRHSWWERSGQVMTTVGGLAAVAAVLFAYSQRRPTGDLDVLAQLVPYHEIPDSLGRSARDPWDDLGLLHLPSSLWLVTVRNNGSAPAQGVSLVLAGAVLAQIIREGRSEVHRVGAEKVPLGTLMPGDEVSVRAWGDASPELIGSISRAAAYSADGASSVRLVHPLSDLDFHITRVARLLFSILLVFGIPIVLGVGTAKGWFAFQDRKARTKNRVFDRPE